MLEKNEKKKTTVTKALPDICCPIKHSMTGHPPPQKYDRGGHLAPEEKDVGQSYSTSLKNIFNLLNLFFMRSHLLTKSFQSSLKFPYVFSTSFSLRSLGHLFGT